MCEVLVEASTFLLGWRLNSLGPHESYYPRRGVDGAMVLRHFRFSGLGKAVGYIGKALQLAWVSAI